MEESGRKRNDPNAKASRPKARGRYARALTGAVPQPTVPKRQILIQAPLPRLQNVPGTCSTRAMVHFILHNIGLEGANP